MAALQLARHLKTVKMGELLTNRSNNPLEIPQNRFGKNDYIKNILECADRKISIEISPNNDFQVESLEKIRPHFIAVTWLGNAHLGLPTHDIPAVVLARKLCDGNFPVLLHLAGRNVGRGRMLEILTYLKEVGVKNILALQGDWLHVLEKGGSKCDFPYASNLVSFIKDTFGDAFCVGVAGYPNIHPQSQDEEEDMKYLKQKVSCGADFIITQATFDYKILEKFAVTCRKYDINAPILPGVFIIKSYQSLMNMMKFCQLEVAENIVDFVEENRENVEVVENYGLDLAGDLIRKCLDNTELFSGVHIFTMNDLAVVEKVVSRL